MSKKKFGVGVFGTGWVAGEHIKAYNNHPDCEIKALVSIHRESAQAKKDFFNLDCDILDTYDQLLQRDDIDIISVCTAPINRAKEIIKCCKSGKHLFSEIHICHNIEELKSVKNAYKKAGIKSINSFVLQQNPMILSIKSLIKKGGLGNLFFIETDYWHELGSWHSGWWWAKQKDFVKSTALLGGLHSLATFLAFGGEVSEVYAYDGRGHRKEFEYNPSFSSIVKFKNGTIGRTGGSFEIECPYTFNIILHGSKGSVINDKFYSKELFKGQEKWQTFASTKPDSGLVEHHPFQAMVNTFIDYINDKDDAIDINMDFAFKVHELALAIDKSAESGEIVKLPLV